MGPEMWDEKRSQKTGARIQNKRTAEAQRPPSNQKGIVKE
jgi:hypothetical protein